MIYGSGFTGATTLKFGDVYVAGWQIKTDGSIDALVPPGTGTVDITVNTPAGTSAVSAADRFTYGTIAITTLHAVRANPGFTTFSGQDTSVTTEVPGTTTVPTAAPATGGSDNPGMAAGSSGPGQVTSMPSIPATSADTGAIAAAAPTTKASPDVPPAIIVTAGVFGLALTGFCKRDRR
jgi:hypothetical protein